MSRYKLIKLASSEPNDDVRLVYEFDGVTLYQMLEAYEDFLCGCGFAVDNLEHVSDEEQLSQLMGVENADKKS